MLNIRKQRKINENIDPMLEFHLNEFKNVHLSNVEFVIKFRETVKMKYLIK